MKLTGYKNEDTKLYYLELVIEIPELNLSRPMTFLVDTGTNMTLICGPDAMDLDLSTLSSRPAIGAIKSNGVSSPLTPLFFCRLNYVNNDKYSKTLDFIGVEQPDANIENEEDFKGSTSILGMDFLEDFKISFNDGLVTLEK